MHHFSNILKSSEEFINKKQTKKHTNSIIYHLLQNRKLKDQDKKCYIIYLYTQAPGQNLVDVMVGESMMNSFVEES